MPQRTRLPTCLRRGPFTSAQALAAGVSARALQGPAVRRLFQDIYLGAELPDTLYHRVNGALLILPPHTVVGGVTALQLLGLNIGPTDPLCFWTTSMARVRRPGLRVARVQELPPHREQVLSGAAIFRTAAEDLGLVDLVAAGDFLVRRDLTTEAEIIAGANSGRRGRVLARRAAPLVRTSVDSPQETRVRLALTLAGLPEPEVHLPLYAGEEFLGTPDLRYRRWRIVLEYEGDHHRTDRRQWAYDVRRYERMSSVDELVVRITGEHMRRLRPLVERVHSLLVSRGYAGPPPHFSAEWLAAFGLSGHSSTRIPMMLVDQRPLRDDAGCYS